MDKFDRGLVIFFMLMVVAGQVLSSARSSDNKDAIKELQEANKHLELKIDFKAAIQELKNGAKKEVKEGK